MHFRLGKTKTRIEFGIEQGVHTNAVQIGKDALLRHAQDARHDGPFEMRVVLEAREEKTAEKSNRFLVKSVRMCRMNPCVVFVDQHDRTNTVDFIQPFGEVFQGPFIRHVARVVVQDRVKVLLVGSCES